MREDEEGSDDFGELLPGLDEQSPEDADDSDPVAGAELELDDALDEEDTIDDDLHDLELGPDSVLPEESEDAGDAAGLEEPDGAEAEPEDTLPADDEERDGIDDARPLVNDLDLPRMDDDAEGTDDDASRFGALPAAAELALPLAARPWRLVRLSPERERCRALALGAGTTVAGSTDLLWLDPGRATPVRVAVDGTRIVSLTLLGAPPDVVVAVTAAGRIVRRARLASDSERVGDLGRTPEEGGPDARGVDLCSLAPERPQTLLARLPSGMLEQSEDAGATLRPIEPRLKVRALSPTKSPVAAISEDGKQLLLSHDAGRSFESRALEGAALAVASGNAPLVASAPGVLALAEPERGLVLSTDAGLTFREIPGAAAVTACAVGLFDGRAHAWFCVYSEAADEARIVMVEAASGNAEVVASIAGGGDDDSDDGTPSGRIDQLGWNGTLLYAVGDPGFFSLEPPRNGVP
jgi:hypothetical protein